MDTLPSTSEGIYEEAYGGKRPQACCPRVGYLHPTAEDSTSADPPGHHLSLPGPAGRFTSDQQMAEGTSSNSSEELSEETHVKTPVACCPRVGYLHPTAEDSTPADPPNHHLSLSGTAMRFKSDQQMAVTTSSSPSLEACEETHVKRPQACCPRAGDLHPTAENTSVDSWPSTLEGTYDQMRRVRCPPVVYLRFPPEHNPSADPAGGQLSLSRPGGRSVSVRPKSSTF